MINNTIDNLPWYLGEFKNFVLWFKGLRHGAQVNSEFLIL